MNDIKIDQYGDLDLNFGGIETVMDFMFVSQYIMILILSDPGDIPFDLDGGFSLSNLIGTASNTQQVRRIQESINYKLSTYRETGVEDVYCEVKKTTDNMLTFTFYYYDQFSNIMQYLPTYTFTNKGEFLYTEERPENRESSRYRDRVSLRMKVKSEEEGILFIDTIIPSNNKFVGVFNSKPSQKQTSVTIPTPNGSQVSIYEIFMSKGIDLNNIVVYNIRALNIFNYDLRFTGSDIMFKVNNNSGYSSDTLTINYYNKTMNYSVTIDTGTDFGNLPNAHRSVTGGIVISSPYIYKGNTYYVTIGESYLYKWRSG